MVRVFHLADFLKELPQIFRKRYLDTHETYLKSIADISAHLYPSKRGDDRPKCEKMVKCLLGAGPFGESLVDSEFESVYFRNLRNAWYNECALNESHDLDANLRFAPWKIVQSYYVILCGIGALVRCFNRSKGPMRQIETLGKFGTEFLRTRQRKAFFIPPFNFHVDQKGNFEPDFERDVAWDYANQYHIPNLRKCLSSVHRVGSITTIPHYLKSLREWAQYEDAYLFFRLYGKSPKRNLAFALSEITFGYLTQIEFFLIKLFGWGAIELQYDTFFREMKSNLKTEPRNLACRFAVYTDYLR